MRALLGARIPRIVYVSCDPATLSRDVARFVAEGYVPGTFIPVDLFPQTHHIETVAVLDLE
jgi:23S rRNA (uracil1939-C5)-methyltransferase